MINEIVTQNILIPCKDDGWITNAFGHYIQIMYDIIRMRASPEVDKLTIGELKNIGDVPPECYELKIARVTTPVLHMPIDHNDFLYAAEQLKHALADGKIHFGDRRNMLPAQTLSPYKDQKA